MLFMTCTALQLAQLLNAEILGPHELTLRDAQPLDFAEGDHVSFVSEQKNFKALQQSRAGAVLVGRRLENDIPDSELEKRAFLIVDDALNSFIEAIKYFRPQRQLPEIGLSEQAIVAESATIGEGSHIYPNAIIGNEVVLGDNCRIMSGAVIGDGCRLGDGVTIYPNVVLYPDVTIGDNVIIHANAVIGADGFGYRVQGGRPIRVPRLFELGGRPSQIVAAIAFERANRESNANKRVRRRWRRLLPAHDPSSFAILLPEQYNGTSIAKSSGQKLVAGPCCMDSRIGS